MHTLAVMRAEQPLPNAQQWHWTPLSFMPSKFCHCKGASWPGWFSVLWLVTQWQEHDQTWQEWAVEVHCYFCNFLTCLTQYTEIWVSAAWPEQYKARGFNKKSGSAPWECLHRLPKQDSGYIFESVTPASVQAKTKVKNRNHMFTPLGTMWPLVTKTKQAMLYLLSSISRTESKSQTANLFSLLTGFPKNNMKTNFLFFICFAGTAPILVQPCWPV